MGFLSFLNIKVIAAIIVAAFLAGCYFYVSHLRSTVAELSTANTQLKNYVAQQALAIDTCNRNTAQLTADEVQASKNLKVALDKAEAATAVNRQLRQTLLDAKPVVVTITETNKQDFGPQKDDERIKDYLSSHNLINEYIDKVAK